MMTEVQIAVICLQEKKHQGFPATSEARRDMAQILP